MFVPRVDGSLQKKSLRLFRFKKCSQTNVPPRGLLGGCGRKFQKTQFWAVSIAEICQKFLINKFRKYEAAFTSAITVTKSNDNRYAWLLSTFFLLQILAKDWNSVRFLRHFQSLTNCFSNYKFNKYLTKKAEKHKRDYANSTSTLTLVSNR